MTSTPLGPTPSQDRTRRALEPRPGILAIEPYVPGRSTVSGGGPVMKLSSNETPFGPSPRAVEAYRAACDTLDRYPDGDALALKQAIGATYDIPAENIVCGTGSDEMIYLLARAYLGPGDEAIYPQHGFLIHKLAMLTCGATPVTVPETNLTVDIDAILERVNARTKAVFIANPNNPTSTYVPASELRRLREGLPEAVLLVIDSAYADYVTRPDYDAGFELVASTPNTVMLRTFSKIFGLASLRLGWAYCPADIADILNRVRGPFNVSGPAMAAGIAALSDQDHVNKARAHNDLWRGWLVSELRGIGLEVTDGVGNFVLIHFPETPSKTAKDADDFLCENRIILRGVTAYGLPNALRMTVGLEQENRAVVETLRRFLER